MIKPEWICICRDPEISITHAMQVPGGVVIRFTEFNHDEQPTSVSMCHVPFVEIIEQGDNIFFKSSMDDMATQVAHTMKKTIEDPIPHDPLMDKRERGRS